MRKLITQIGTGLKVIIFALVIFPTGLGHEPEIKADAWKPEEYRCMAWVLHDEARGESLKGARAVLDVVLARMKATGKSACEVIAQPRQFSGYKGHKALYELSDETLRRFVKVAKMKPVAVECKHFHATYVRPVWATKMRVCFRIGRHVFLKEIHKEKKHDNRK